jgi:hypothetical protein
MKVMFICIWRELLKMSRVWRDEDKIKPELLPFLCNTYIHTYHSRFIPEGVEEASQIFLREAHVLPKLLSYEKYCRRDRW